MNRCITCSKIVTRPKAQNEIKHNGHQFMVCCPMCEKEFNRDPEYYMAIAKSIFGEFGIKAYSQASLSRDEKRSLQVASDPYDNIRMLQNLHDGFEQINRRFAELAKHFDEMSGSGGLEGLRSELQKHRIMMDSLQKEMSVQAGVCQFVISVTESFAKKHA